MTSRLLLSNCCALDSGLEYALSKYNFVNQTLDSYNAAMLLTR